MMQEKTLNQLFKQSGTTVSFPEYVRRHNEKKQYQNATGTNVATTNFQSVFEVPFKEFVSSSSTSGSASTDGKVLGLNKTVLYISLSIVVVAIIIYFARNKNALQSSK